jgi:transcriptional regulator with XRE-family HTH domain
VHKAIIGFGAEIKAARKQKGLTQETLAERVGIGQRHIMGIENESKGVSIDVLYKLVRELNLSVDAMFYPEKNRENKELQQLVRLLERCGEREIRAITALVEALLEE